MPLLKFSSDVSAEIGRVVSSTISAGTCLLVCCCPLLAVAVCSAIAGFVILIPVQGGCRDARAVVGCKTAVGRGGNRLQDGKEFC